MLVPFGTHVVDSERKSVGTVSRLVLHPTSQEVVALVVQQGVLNRREVVVRECTEGQPRRHAPSPADRALPQEVR